jgi:hypothetical protein
MDSVLFQRPANGVYQLIGNYYQLSIDQTRRVGMIIGKLKVENGELSIIN